MINYKEFLQSSIFKKTLVGIGALIIALGIFQAGIFVGYHKAAFFYKWGENYYRTFGKPEREAFMGMRRDEFSNAHGAIGKIIKISLPTVVIEDRDNLEKVISLKADTTILRFRKIINPSDLKVDDYIVVIGSPNDTSEVEAKLVRVIPSLSDFMLGTSTSSSSSYSRSDHP